MSRFDEKRSWGYDAQSSLTHTFQNTQAMGDAIEALEDRVKALEAAAPMKAAPLTDGDYLVRWIRCARLTVARLCQGHWFEEVPSMIGGRSIWKFPSDDVSAPHWIGPRVDMREG